MEHSMSIKFKSSKKTMWKYLASIALSIVFFGLITTTTLAGSTQKTSDEIIILNNKGVRLLNAHKYEQAINIFEDILKKDSQYKMARVNLSIAYNNYGLFLQNHPQKSLNCFAEARFLVKENPSSKSNSEKMMLKLKLNPNSRKDYIKLANTALVEGKPRVAIVHFEDAEAIQTDPSTADILKKLLAKHPRVSRLSIVCKPVQVTTDRYLREHGIPDIYLVSFQRSPANSKNSSKVYRAESWAYLKNGKKILFNDRKIVREKSIKKVDCDNKVDLAPTKITSTMKLEEVLSKFGKPDLRETNSIKGMHVVTLRYLPPKNKTKSFTFVDNQLTTVLVGFVLDGRKVRTN